MTRMSAFLADWRRRNLAILAAGALVAIALAAFGIHEQEAETAPRYTPETFFPGLAGEITRVTTIHIDNRKGSFDVAFEPGKGWVLPQHEFYPASLDEVRQTLVSLAALETIEPRTSRADWMHYLDLDAPPHGNATHIVLRDQSGNVLAGLLVGKTEDIGDPGGAVGLFVRKDGDPQSWLVESPTAPKSDPADWLDKTVMAVDRARIQEVDVAPASGPGFIVRRDRPSDADFALSPIPPGRELANPYAPDGVASAIVGFSFIDAVPAKDLDFSHATRLVTRTFDGLTVTVNVVPKGSEIWATVSAEAAAGNANTQAEMRQINAQAAGWAYKLPNDQGQLYLTTLESLLKPPGAPAKTGP